MLAPLLALLSFTALRFIVALASISVLVKLYDLHQAVELGSHPGPWEFLTYLSNECNLVIRSVADKSRPPKLDASRLLWLVPISIALALAVIALWRVDWQPYPRPLEQCVKVQQILAAMQQNNAGGQQRPKLQRRAPTKNPGSLVKDRTAKLAWQRTTWT
jgi:hypothetical protein